MDSRKDQKFRGWRRLGIVEKQAKMSLKAEPELIQEVMKEAKGDGKSC